MVDKEQVQSKNFFRNFCHKGQAPACPRAKV